LREIGADTLDSMSPHANVPLPANRLGFAVKVTGRPGLKEGDSRRWQNDPHLRVSIGYLDAIFDYLGETGLRMYRISSDIAPYVTHPDLPQFHAQIEECLDELATLGAKARSLDLRLSMHPSQYIVLNAVDERVARAASSPGTSSAPGTRVNLSCSKPRNRAISRKCCTFAAIDCCAR